MNEGNRELVSFRYRNEAAKSVVIAGLDGDWHPSFLPMENCGGGLWQKYLPMLPGEHHYRFIVDGDWNATGLHSVTVPPSSADTETISPEPQPTRHSQVGWTGAAAGTGGKPKTTSNIASS